MRSIVDVLFEMAPRLREGAKASSSYAMVRCPFHSGGNERTPSMSVSADRPVFMCHGCGESGHVSRLLRHFGMGKDAVTAALRNAGVDATTHHAKPVSRVAAKLAVNINPFRGRFILDESILDGWRLAPRLLLDAGFSKRTLRHFEVGYDERHLRITFPLRNVYGDLVGVSGRAVIDGVEPRYKIYTKEEFNAIRGFHVPDDYTMEGVKEGVLWHAQIVRPFLLSVVEPVVITEGFKACMWVWQYAYENVVALVGTALTETHAELIATAMQQVILFLDNNEAGWRGTFRAGDRLVKAGVESYVAIYPDDRQQPDGLTSEEAQSAVAHAIPYLSWRSNHGKRFVHEAASRVRRYS